MKIIKGGSFKTMNLDSKLYFSIPHKNPTPIQRKAIPAILNGQNVIGIARTGSGKTFAYLIPIVQKILSGKKALVLVPTRDLIYQVSNFLKTLTRELKVKAVLVHGGIDVEVKDYDIIISTVGRLRHENLDLHVDILVVDEVDRIFEEGGMRNDFLTLEKKLSTERQNVYFSATLPENMISLVSDFVLIQIDAELSETLQHYFFYVPSPLKEAALLFLMSTITAKTIIFTTTKYSVDVISEILRDRNVRSIYSSMDQCLRRKNMNDFINGVSKVLVVTDLAARGLDIPFLEVVINYDMCDEKMFLHRVGRVARNGKIGTQYSLVSFKDVFNFFRIRKAYFTETELGSIPYSCLDKFSATLNAMELGVLRNIANNANIKASKFIKKAILEDSCKEEVQNIKTHTYFSRNKKLEAREVFISEIHGRKKKDVVEKKGSIDEDKFKDQFFIPYAFKPKSLHSITMNTPKDEHEQELRRINKGWQQRKRILFGKKDEKKVA